LQPWFTVVAAMISQDWPAKTFKLALNPPPPGVMVPAAQVCQMLESVNSAGSRSFTVTHTSLQVWFVMPMLKTTVSPG
jgi:hypothetical protein